VPRIALTATADALTRDDIVHHLQLEQARHFVSSFDRPNIRYAIVEKKDSLQQLLRFIEQEHSGEVNGRRVHDAGVVYCQSRRKVEDVAAQFHRINGNVEIQTTDTHACLRRLMAGGVDITGLTVRSPNLEDVFLNLTGRKLRA
jgi:superfamily II DNA helicase RecQ